MAHPQHSSEAARRELGAAQGHRQPPEPWPSGHLPARASGEQISAAAPAASSLQPFLPKPAALVPWFYGLDLLHSFSSSEVKLQRRAIFQSVFSEFSLTSISSCSASAPVTVCQTGSGCELIVAEEGMYFSSCKVQISMENASTYAWWSP